jgi:hypothetical protein
MVPSNSGSRSPWLGWLTAVVFACAAAVLARLCFDLGRMHLVIALCVGAFYLGFLVLVGTNVTSLLRGRDVGAEATRFLHWSLALAVPIAFLAASMDCMGLGFVGCTTACDALMHFIAPATAACTLLYAATGARGWILAATALALSFFYPNCVCRNPVNLWWIRSLGRSPACYASGVAVFLVAGTTLVTRRRVRLAALLAWGVVATTLAFWVGHHYFDYPW